MRASETRLSEILDIAADAIISIDEAQHVILFNKAAEQMFGYAADEVIGHPLDQLLPLRLRSAHRDNIARFIRSSSSARRMGERLNVQGRRRDGEEFQAEAAISKISAGGHYITTVVVRDIADRLRTEDALRQQRMELYRVLRTATMGELTVALAHEINQPLAAILGDANAGRRFLQSGTSKLTEVDQILEEIVEDTKRAAGVIQRIRSLLEKHEIDTQPLDVNTIVGDIIALVHRDSVKRGVDMRLDLNSNLPLIADPARRGRGARIGV